MAYGWSPEQLARINARRQARGRETLDPGKIGPRYAQRYSDEYEKRNRIKSKNENEPMEEDLTPLEMYLRDIEMRKSMRSPMQTPRGTAA